MEIADDRLISLQLVRKSVSTGRNYQLKKDSNESGF